MEIKTSTWFECKISYYNSLGKKQTDVYAVDADSFAVAEFNLLSEISDYIDTDYEIKNIKKAKYKEIITSNDSNADRYYQVDVHFITFDEKTDKEKHSSIVYLVQATSLKDAIGAVDEAMRTSMIDYMSVGAKETKIVDVIERKSDSVIKQEQETE